MNVAVHSQSIMIINKLELVNFRKHRRLDVVLEQGVTAIVGDNGTGKSSIVEALQFALTGELNFGKKADAITVGEDSGYVRLLFTLNNKKGTLIRPLTSTAPELVYDGKTLKKAGEVKELWDTLLQVGPEIISKVIIAHQGDIPLLFSGEAAIREKIFQKIFLVPPTEKIRNVIFQKYLKQLPPLLPVEDLEALKGLINNVEAKISKLDFDISQLSLLAPQQIDEHKERIRFLLKCEQDAGASVLLQKSIEDAKEKVTETKEVVAELFAVLSSIRIDDYELLRNTQLQQKALYTQKCKLLAEYDSLIKIQVDEKVFSQAKEDLTLLDEELATLSAELAGLQYQETTVKKQIERYGTVNGNTCHACGQALHSVYELVNMLQGSLQETHDQQQTLKANIAALKTKAQELKKYIDSIEEAKQKEARLAESLAQFEGLEFEESSLTTYTEVIRQYREYEQEHNAAKLELTKAVNHIKLLQHQHNALSVYDNRYDSIAVERDIVTDILHKHDEAYRLYQIYNSDRALRSYELTALQDRLTQSKVHAEKNKKRNRYSEILSTVYDVLHTENFPRKLILNYAEVVSEYLQEKLQGFNIPYRAKLSDGFRIDMYNENNERVPKVSGGQEIQVGISLHLALHELFSQSFPLLVIDEGTTHLDATNRKAYFDIIKKLKSNNKLQQIIIIDHDPQLSEVVDHVISLNENG